MGTHETGPNYTTLADAIYVITPDKCVELDPATGQVAREFSLPPDVPQETLWTTVRAEGDLLVFTIGPLDTKRNFEANARVGAAAQWLAAYDRKAGTCLWSRKAVHGWRSNGVVVTGGKVYVIDARGTIGDGPRPAPRVERGRSVPPSGLRWPHRSGAVDVG